MHWSFLALRVALFPHCSHLPLWISKNELHVQLLHESLYLGLKTIWPAGQSLHVPSRWLYFEFGGKALVQSGSAHLVWSGSGYWYGCVHGLHAAPTLIWSRGQVKSWQVLLSLLEIWPDGHGSHVPCRGSLPLSPVPLTILDLLSQSSGLQRPLFTPLFCFLL